MVEQTDKSVSRFMTFIAILYVVEGWAQVTGILHLPINYFCKQVLHWDAGAVAGYISGLGFLWSIKFVYGFISDSVPILGYRRKSYLIGLNALAVGAFAFTAVSVSPGKIIVALFFITLAMAFSSTICGALLVENAKSSGHSNKFCSQQSLWANIANITAALIGGYLCQFFTGKDALHFGAALCMFAPLAALIASWRLIDEPKRQFGKSNWHGVVAGLKDAVHSKVIWLVAVYLVLYAFNPGFGTPLYYHMTDHLHYSQKFIGFLAAWFAVGSAFGAIAFRKLSKHIPMNRFVVLLIVAGAITQFCFVFMHGGTSAIVLNVLNGFMTAAAALSAHVVAANKCPNGSEGFVYSVLIGLTNAAYFSSQGIGGWLYTSVFQSAINPLIVLSAALTLLCLVVVPFVNFEKDDRPTWYQQLKHRRA